MYLYMAILGELIRPKLMEVQLLMSLTVVLMSLKQTIYKFVQLRNFIKSDVEHQYKQTSHSRK